MPKSTLRTVIETDLTDRRWLWKIEGKNVSIYGENTYSSEEKAAAAVHTFINKCLTDRSTWPDEFK